METARVGSGNASGPGQRQVYLRGSDEECTVVDNAADELELIALSKRPTRSLPHASPQEATPMKKIWGVKLVDDAHAPEIISGQLYVV